MKVERFIEIIGSDFYTGVPDSQLKALCNYLVNTYGRDSRHHIIAANEGNCAAIVRRVITWLREKFLLFICKTAERGISLIRRQAY